MAARRSAWVRGMMVAGLFVAGPAMADPVAPDTIVRIKAVAPADAFFSSRKDVVGLICAVDAAGLAPQGKGRKWVVGGMKCADGQDYYFFKVAVVPGDYGVDLATIRGPEAPAIEPVPGDWKPGDRVRIVGLSPEDAHVGDAEKLVGVACTVGAEPLSTKEDSFHGGELKCDNGMDLYFYKVELTALEPAPAP